MERTIRVTGKGKISVKPDRIRLHINVEGTKGDYETTLQSSTETIEELKDLVENLGFQRSDLKTLYFNVDTVYDSYQDRDKSWKKRFMGYKFIHRLKLEFDADNKMLGKILYALAHCSVAPEFSIEYTISNPEDAKNELLGNAIKDSLQKAKILTDAAKVSLGEIQSIDYSWGEIEFVTRPMSEQSLRCLEPVCCEDSSYDIDIEADDIDISDTVTVVWGIK